MRDFHATPELCPPPAASADIARRRLLTAVAAAPVIAAAFPASAERRSDDDAPLFAMSRRIAELESEIKKLFDEVFAREEALPLIKWSPEELAQHRIVGAHDAPRFVSEDDINDSDRRDAPPRAKRKTTKKDDGVTLVRTYTTTRCPSAEAETTAWRERCAARRALYDEKKAVYDKANAASGIEKFENMQAKAWDEIFKILDKVAAYQPKTIAGVVEKMRIFKNEHADIFSRPSEELDVRDSIFLSALADFERLASL
jgi:hypothetical protein